MADSKIEWTDKVWNPTTGCSLGCTYCYAEKMAHRLQAMGQRKYCQGFAPTCHPGELVKPVRWKKPARVFINSMGDLFDPAIPEEFINKVVTTLSLFPEHTFQLLTKQPQRMQEYFSAHQVPPNLWLGVTVENQAAADARLPFLLQTPATVRFLSVEPMIGRVELPLIKRTLLKASNHFPGVEYAGDGGYSLGVDWVIVGGMTGKDAVPMHLNWVRTLRDQCQAADVPFFFKSWGEWLPWSQFNEAGIEDNAESTRFRTMEWTENGWADAGYPIWCDWVDGAIDPEHCTGRIGKKSAGALIDGQEWKQFPEVVK